MTGLGVSEVVAVPGTGKHDQPEVAVAQERIDEMTAAEFDARTHEQLEEFVARN